MRPFAILGTLMLPMPALAHGGAHLHPHGFETAVAFGAGIALALLGVLLLRR